MEKWNRFERKLNRKKLSIDQRSKIYFKTRKFIFCRDHSGILLMKTHHLIINFKIIIIKIKNRYATSTTTKSPRA